ncbi:bifunctional DNA primase/polymerase [Actinomycetes bacterium KLBMP 9797]
MPDLLTSALDHAGRGWHVFPLRPSDKRPAFPDHAEDACTGRDPRCRTAGRHVGWEERATVDPGRISRAWRSGRWGIGIACGPSGLLVVDLDRPKTAGGPDGIDTFGTLCEQHHDPDAWVTYTVRTGSGGLHLYYRHPPTGPRLRNTQGGLGPAVDTRAHGGYVVAAGSTVDGRRYEVDGETDPVPLAGWLAARLRPAPLPPQRPVVLNLGTGRQAAYVHAAIERETALVAEAVKGERNHVLYSAAIVLGQLVAGGALAERDATTALTDAAGRAGLSPTETARTIRSGLRAGAKRPRSVAA